MLSDPPSYPLAYHALSWAFSHGPSTCSATGSRPPGRGALSDVVRASWRLAGPDGDLA